MSWQPLPKEEAYGLYLLETVFPDVLHGPTFRIPGRLAVPFFTRSNVNRLVLRNVWTAVDPQGTGSLTDRYQFYVVLRLISLAQSGILLDCLASAYEAKQTPVVAMQVCLTATRDEVLPLATFEGIQVPRDAALHTIYNKYSTGDRSSASDFGEQTSFGAPIQLPEQQQQQQYLTGLPPTFPAGQSSSAAKRLSIDDAFGDLGPVQDAPLPSLASPAIVGSNDTGSFGGGSTGFASSVGGDGPEAPTMPSQPVPSDVSAASLGRVNLASPPAATVAGMDPLGPSVTASGGGDSVGGMSGSHAANLSIGSASYAPMQMSQQQQHPFLRTSVASVDTIGSAASVGTANIPVEPSIGVGGISSFGSASATVASISDVFGGMVEVPNQPLPALQPVQPVNTSGFMGDAENEQQGEDDDDDFGDFVAVPGPDQSESQLQEPEEAAPAPATLEVSGWDALDALAGDDAPLPPLAQLQEAPPVEAVSDNSASGEASSGWVGGASTAVPLSTEMTQIPEQDSFGGLEPTPSTPQTTAADDEFGTFTEAPHNEEQKPSSPRAAPLSSGFEPTGAVYRPSGNAIGQSDLLGSRGRSAVSNTKSDLRMYTETNTRTQHRSEPGVSEAVSESSVPVGLSAFDAFGEIDNTPLPDLSMLGSTLNAVVADVDDETDGFGEFEAADTSKCEGISMSHSSETGAAVPVLFDENENDTDGFGEFETADATPPHPEGQRASSSVPSAGASGWDALDALAGSHDNPLPPLQTIDSMAKSDNGGEDMFGEGKNQQDDAVAENALEVSEGVDLFSSTTEPIMTLTGDDFDDIPSPTASNSFTIGGRSDDLMKGHGLTSGSVVGASGGDGSFQSGEKDMPPPPPQSSMQNNDRLDSEYYSAATSISGSAVSDDSNGFESAVENLEGEQSRREEQVSNTPMMPLGQQDDSTQSPNVVPVLRTSGDPFAAFDALNMPEPEIPPLSSMGSTEAKPDADSDANYQNADADAAFGAQGGEFGDGDFSGFLVSKETKRGPGSTAEGSLSAERADISTEASEPAKFGKGPVSNLIGSIKAMQESSGFSGEEDDDFGDFSGFQSPEEIHVSPSFDAEAVNHSAVGATSLSAEHAEHILHSIDDAQIQMNIDEAAVNGGEEGHDEFGNFGVAELTSALASVSEPEAVDTDEFGDVGSAGIAPTSTSGAFPSASSEEEFGNFGDFGSAELAPAPTAEVAATSGVEEDDLGDFGDFGSAELTLPAGKTGEKEAEDFGDFGSAEITSSGGKEFDEARERLALVKQQIVSSSLRLPEPIRRRLGNHGDLVDYGDVFDSNIGFDVPVSDERRKRASCCLQIMDLLSSRYAKLASTYWGQAISVAREELSTGFFLLEEASSVSLDAISVCREKLETYVHGLGEFVRVTRSIVATIGDLLMLETSAVLTIDTLTFTWCSIPLLKDALEVEKLWRDVANLGTRLKLASKQDTPHRLESLAEIRALAASRRSRVTSTEQLCQFTLQPLPPPAHVPLTKSSVTWDGHAFMACTANFLKHKCPFYAVDSC